MFMRTTRGPKRVDVIYRRIDDDFLDPLAFRKDSMLGVAGLLSAYRAQGDTVQCDRQRRDRRQVDLPHVPEMIRRIWARKPILNNIPTYRCRDASELSACWPISGELVVKEVHGAGGYGMLVGPTSSKQEIEAFRARLVSLRTLHRAADPLRCSPHLCRVGCRAAPYRPAALRAVGQGSAHGSGRLDSRRPARRGPWWSIRPGWWHQNTWVLEA